ncbi:hypothetical protein Tco_0610802 [Tanacetum coccineum]
MKSLLSTKHGNVSKDFFGNVLIMVSRNYINLIRSIILCHSMIKDALDSAAGGNFLDKMPRDGLAIIESKSRPLLLKLNGYSNEPIRKSDSEKNVNGPCYVKAVKEFVLHVVQTITFNNCPS